MDHIRGTGTSPQPRVRKSVLSRKGKRALSQISSSPDSDTMSRVHMETEALKHFAERFRRKKGAKFYEESTAQFDLDPETGKVFLKIVDSETGEVEIRISADELAEGLKRLEETDDNDAPLASFFVDITV